MRDFRFTLPRKHQIKNKIQKHWYERNDTLINEVLSRIKSEGPLMAKDFEGDGKKKAVWELKPNKQALEYLFMQGDLMISSRQKFHKVYDLTERVLHPDVNFQMPSKEEYSRFLIKRYLAANGLGKISEITYLQKKGKVLISDTLDEMIHSGELIQIRVKGQTYYALPRSLELLNNSLSRSKLKILSPFDNLLIQRKRTKELFGFDYLLECYVPGPKRKFGYFVLPILWKGNLVARMDCKAERKTSVFRIHSLSVEKAVRDVDSFSNALEKELKAFMTFNGCESIEWHEYIPSHFQ
tara:strand:+ start:543 stop:1430 length:888 start_codon:yes stop_codon:yes gene_type:complete